MWPSYHRSYEQKRCEGLQDLNQWPDSVQGSVDNLVGHRSLHTTRLPNSVRVCGWDFDSLLRLFRRDEVSYQTVVDRYCKTDILPLPYDLSSLCSLVKLRTPNKFPYSRSVSQGNSLSIIDKEFNRGFKTTPGFRRGFVLMTVIQYFFVIIIG